MPYARYSVVADAILTNHGTLARHAGPALGLSPEPEVTHLFMTDMVPVGLVTHRSARTHGSHMEFTVYFPCIPDTSRVPTLITLSVTLQHD